MGLEQSTLRDPEEEEEDELQITAEIDEENGATEIITVGPVKRYDDDSSAGSEYSRRPSRRFVIMIALTLLAIIVVSVTAPLVVKSLKKERPDPDADVDYGETPIRPVTENVGALPSSSDQTPPGNNSGESSGSSESFFGDTPRMICPSYPVFRSEPTKSV